MKKCEVAVFSHYVEIKTQELIQRIQPVTEEIFRCTAFHKGQDINKKSVMIETQSDALPEFTVKEMPEFYEIKTSGAGVRVDISTGQLTWIHADGSVWLKEKGKELEPTDVVHYVQESESREQIRKIKTVDGERNQVQNLKAVIDRKASRARIFFQWKDGEQIHGLGQGEDGIYDYRGHTQYLYQHNMRIPMPVFVSTEGYGILLDCSSLMVFQEKKGQDASITLDTVDQLDYYFLGGKTMDGVIHDYRYLTGKAEMLPRWAYGYIQSKECYHTAEELKFTAEHYRRLQIPLDCVVQDWNTWKPGEWGNKITDKTRYGNLKECLERIHELNVHAMVSIWPNMSEECENGREFSEKGYLLLDHSTYNAFEEDARKLYWAQAERELWSSGFDAWWCDSTEPFPGPDWCGEKKREPLERYRLVGGEHKKFLDAASANIYGLMHAKGIYENQKKVCREKRVLNLTRSGYASGQKYAAVLWSGDICASWEQMRIQITEGLNMSMSGYPYWTMDIGGFFTVGKKWQNRGCGCSNDPTPKWFWNGTYDDGVRDKGYCELYTRWLELGTFLPMFRSHGTDTPREIWNFGEKGSMFYDAIEKYIRLRYRLMPYIYSMAARVHFKDETIMRSLLFDFAEDEEAGKISNEFMFGRSLLICPVTEPMYYEADSKPVNREKTWKCYLPGGTGWYDYWNNRFYQGGRYVTVEAPLERIPVFVKEGSILPEACGLQYADQQPEAPLKFRIYAGKDAAFQLYEDEGDNYNFENGIYAITDFFWDEKQQKFTEGNRKGSYNEMRKTAYEIEIISHDRKKMDQEVFE